MDTAGRVDGNLFYKLHHSDNRCSGRDNLGDGNDSLRHIACVFAGCGHHAGAGRAGSGFRRGKCLSRHRADLFGGSGDRRDVLHMDTAFRMGWHEHDGHYIRHADHDERDGIGDGEQCVRHIGSGIARGECCYYFGGARCCCRSDNCVRRKLADVFRDACCRRKRLHMDASGRLDRHIHDSGNHHNRRREQRKYLRDCDERLRRCLLREHTGSDGWRRARGTRFRHRRGDGVQRLVADLFGDSGERCHLLHMDASGWMDGDFHDGEHHGDGRSNRRKYFRDGRLSLRHISRSYACCECWKHAFHAGRHQRGYGCVCRRFADLFSNAG